MKRETRPESLKMWAAILCLALAPLGCEQKKAYVAPPPPNVTVSMPIEREITDFAEYTASTEAVETVDVRARVEGYLEKVQFRDGARVSRGDLLFAIERETYQAKLDQAKAEVKRREAELSLADATLRRKEAALKDRAVSEIDVIEARAKKDMAAAALVEARAGVDTARLNVSYTEVYAPIEGKITRRFVDAGNLVGAGEKTLLATIVRDDPIYAYFNVSEKDLLSYRQQFGKEVTPLNQSCGTGVTFSVSGRTEETYEGCLDYVDNRVDRSTGTIQVRAAFLNSDHGLLPGLFGRIRMPVGGSRRVLLVPERSLGADQRGRFLLLVNEEEEVEYRQVKEGVLVSGMRVVEEGIDADDEVIVNGLQQVRPGAKVTRKYAEPDVTEPPRISRNSADGGRKHD